MANTRKTKDFNVDRHIGRCIRYYRTLRGLTQQALARQLLITFQQLQKYEKGVSSISSTTLMKISRILKCNIYDFLPDYRAEGSDKSFAAEGIRAIENPFDSSNEGEFDEKDLKYIVKSFYALESDEQDMVSSFIETLIKKRKKRDREE